MFTKNNFVANISSATPLTSNIQLDELVINWHITEACNYNCIYCFAKWGKPNELHRSLEAIEKLLDNLAVYFISGDSLLKNKLGYKNVRLNLAGGEPMMMGSTLSIILMLAKQKGFKTSLITNGHYLLNTKFDLPNDILDMVGVSFDSQSYDVRCQIGRVDRKGNSLSSEDLKFVLEKLSSTQKNLKIKINTVVNELNYQENFSDFISEIRPYKWKVFHVMPYGKDELLISNEKFNLFVSNHNHLGFPIFAESNSDMTESYIMIDPKGRFYQNSASGSGYQFSECINDVGAESALKQINFILSAFIVRYLPNIPLVFIDEEVTL